MAGNKVSITVMGKRYSFDLTDEEKYQLTHKLVTLPDGTEEIVNTTPSEQRVQLLKHVPLTTKQEAIGSFAQLQDVVTFGKGDEISAGLKALMALVPGGDSPGEAYRKSHAEQNDLLDIMRAQYPVGTALTEGVGGYLGGKGAIDVASGLGKKLAGGSIPEKISAYSYAKTNPGQKVPLHLRPENTLRQSMANYAKAATLGGAGAADYAYWSGEGGLPLDETSGDRWGRAAQAAPWGVALGTALPAAATGIPALAQKAGGYADSAIQGASDLISKLSGRATHRGEHRALINDDLAKSLGIPPDTWLPVEMTPYGRVVKAGGAEIGEANFKAVRGEPEAKSASEAAQSSYTTESDTVAAADVIGSGRLLDSMVPTRPSTVQRTGMEPEEMLGDQGSFEPLMLRSSLAAGGESAASAEARARLENRAANAGLIAENIPHERAGEVDVRGDTARGLIDEATTRRDVAYAATEGTPDIMPIPKGAQLTDDLQKSVLFKDAFDNARTERKNTPGAVNDYPNTVDELLGGYRKITAEEVNQYETVMGWKVVQMDTGQKDLAGQVIPEYRAMDPKGAHLTLQQVNELNKGMTTAQKSYEGSPQEAAPQQLQESFRSKYVKGSPSLEAAGERAYETGRLTEAAADTPATLLALKPDELARHLDYDMKAQTKRLEGEDVDMPHGRERTQDQKDVILESLWDDVSKQVREAKGRVGPELIDSVQVMMRDSPEAFAHWKHAVENAEKYGLSSERAGSAVKPDKDYAEDLRQVIGGMGRRMAEFFFSAPFAATRALDRALTHTSLIRNKAVNDAVVDLLTQTGKKRDAAERLIQERIAKQTTPSDEKKAIRDILAAVMGFGPLADDASEAPYLGAAGDIVGTGLLATGKFAGGLIPGVN